MITIAYTLVIAAFLFALHKNNDPYKSYISSKSYRKTTI